MTPEEIIDAYNVLAEDVRSNTATEAARIGNAQRSLGPLAAAVASPSGQTSGLANYTYNRTMRPVVDSMSTKLITTGKAAALENKLSADLRAAKNAYEDAKNAYTVAASAPKTNPKSPYGETTDKEFTGKRKDESTETKDSTAPGTADKNAMIDTVNNMNQYTGSGQLPREPQGQKFSYTLNGSKHVGYYFPGEGGEVDGFSFTKDGLRSYLGGKVSNGATIQNYLGRDIDWGIFLIQAKL